MCNFVMVTMIVLLCPMSSSWVQCQSETNTSTPKDVPTRHKSTNKPPSFPINWNNIKPLTKCKQDSYSTRVLYSISWPRTDCRTPHFISRYMNLYFTMSWLELEAIVNPDLFYNQTLVLHTSRVCAIFWNNNVTYKQVAAKCSVK